MKGILLKLLLLFILIINIPCPGSCQMQDLESLYNQSMEAYKKHNYKEFERLNLAALQLHPSHPSILYNLAASYVLNNKVDSALEILSALISWKADVNFEGDPDFASLDETNRKKLQSEKEKYSTGVETSAVMITLQNTFHLEDLLVRGNKVVVTDVHSGEVLQYDTVDKSITRLAKLPGAALALTTDVAENCIWVSSSVIPNWIGFKEENENTGAFIKINVEKRQHIATIEIPKGSIIGSMIRIGDRIYATNSLRPELIVLDINTNQILKTLPVSGAYNLQGITSSENEKYAYVADYIAGIAKIDLESGVLQGWLNSDAYLLKGIDGISYVDPNTLIAIQNNAVPNRVIKIRHDEKTIHEITLLDNALTVKGEPTNGKYVPSKGFIYITNSQWPFYDRSGKPQLNKWEPQQIRFLQLR